MPTDPRMGKYCFFCDQDTTIHIGQVMSIHLALNREDILYVKYLDNPMLGHAEDAHYFTFNKKVQDDIEHLYTTLDAVATWSEGWNGYDALPAKAESVEYAKIWITKLYQEVMHDDISRWIHPTITPGENGQIVFDWRTGSATLTIFLEEEKGEYLKFWGDIIHYTMEDGDILQASRSKTLFDWFQEQERKWIEKKESEGEEKTHGNIN